MRIPRRSSRAVLLSLLAFAAGAILAGQTIGSVQESQAMVGARGISVPPVARTSPT